MSKLVEGVPELGVLVFWNLGKVAVHEHPFFHIPNDSPLLNTGNKEPIGMLDSPASNGGRGLKLAKARGAARWRRIRPPAMAGVD